MLECQCGACVDERMHGEVITVHDANRLKEEAHGAEQVREDVAAKQQEDPADPTRGPITAETPLPTDKEDLKECCFDLRTDIEKLKGRLAGLIENHPALKQGPQTKINEPLPNAWLAYRKLEDSRMRLGKVIQALDGGIAEYRCCRDKLNKTGTATETWAKSPAKRVEETVLDSRDP